MTPTKPDRRWYQFRLSTIFWLTAVVAVLCAARSVRLFSGICILTIPLLLAFAMRLALSRPRSTQTDEYHESTERHE